MRRMRIYHDVVGRMAIEIDVSASIVHCTSNLLDSTMLGCCSFLLRPKKGFVISLELDLVRSFLS